MGWVKPESITQKGSGFETELVNLPVKQLEGHLTVNSSNRTHVAIEFKFSKPH